MIQSLLAASPEVKAALITVIGAVSGAWLLYLSTIRVARKNLFVTTVTADRTRWRAELREATGNLIEIALIALATPDVANIATMNRHRVSIRLRLNPSRAPEHALDMSISDALRDLGPAVNAQRQIEVYTLLTTIETKVQALLKQEWEKSKREADSGRLEP
jgi:hypothetical protein